MLSIAPAELWVVEPAEKPEQFTQAIAYLLSDGVDFAFGEGDILPTEPPESLDGIKMILVYLEDLPRIQGQLRGFRGFNPDADPPYDLSQGIWRASETATPTDTEHFRAWFVQTYLHENNRTWLAVYGREALGFPNRIQSPLLLTGELSLNSKAFKKRLLARPDRWIRDLWIEKIIQSPRRDWGDITFNHGKQLLDDYEVTGDQRCLNAAMQLYSEMLEQRPAQIQLESIFPSANLPRLFELTGDAKYLTRVKQIAADALGSLPLQKGSTGWCHAVNIFSPATREYLLAQGHGEMGCFGEQMAGIYNPMLVMAKYTDREAEIVDLVAECAKTLARNLRDENTGLYWHGLAARREGQKHFMGHGTGWSAFGLSMILDSFPQNHPDYEILLGLLRDLCDAVAKWQDEEGAFHSILDLPWTLPNLHYTGWLGYVFLRGARLGYLNARFRERGIKAWNSIKAKTFHGGTIGAAAGSPVARSFDYYIERFGQRRTDIFARGIAHQGSYALNEILRLQ